MTPLKKGQPREEDRDMWGCGLRPHPHISPSPLLEGSFFNALIYLSHSHFYSLNHQTNPGLDVLSKINHFRRRAP